MYLLPKNDPSLTDPCGPYGCPFTAQTMVGENGPVRVRVKWDNGRQRDFSLGEWEKSHHRLRSIYGTCWREALNRT